MVNDPAGRTRQRLLIVAGVAFCGLACLAFSLYLIGRLAQPSPIERAVRASFPTFCAKPGERVELEIVLFTQPVWRFNRWAVYCEPGPAPWKAAAMEIDVSSCTVYIPSGNMDWGEMYGSLFVNGQKMNVCP